MLKVLIDTREKDDATIAEVREQFEESEFCKLETGDYSVIVNGIDFRNKLAVERKRNLDELAKNLNRKNSTRLFNEFRRAKTGGMRLVLFIQNSSVEKIKCHAYKSKMNPNAILGFLRTAQNSYGVEVILYSGSSAGLEIKNILTKYAEEYINGKNSDCKY